MSQAIRSYIRNIILESMVREAFPPTSPDIELDEALPRTKVTASAPSAGAASASPSSASSSAGPAAPTAAPLADPPDPQLSVYLADAVDFLSANDLAIGAAADYIVDTMTGPTSPDEIMELYEAAVAVDQKYGQHDTVGNAKNWTVLLLGCALETIVGQSLLNYLPGLLTSGERLIVRAVAAASPAGALQERTAGARRRLLREATVGGTMLRALRGPAADWIPAFTRALDDAAIAAASSLPDIDTLRRALAGGRMAELGGQTLADHVRDAARKEILGAALKDIRQPWCADAQAALGTAGVIAPKVDDFLNPPRGTIYTSQTTLVQDNLDHVLLAIATADDAVILAAVKRGESLFSKSPAARAVAATADSSPSGGAGRGGFGGGGGRVGVGVVRGAGSAVSAVATALGGLGLIGTPLSVLLGANYLDSQIDTSVSPDLLAAMKKLLDAQILLGERITGMDLALGVLHDKSNRFQTTRTRLAAACSEYYIASQGCADFQLILRLGPYKIGQ